MRMELVMLSEKAARLVDVYQQGAITLMEVCSRLIDLAGEEGAAPVVGTLPVQLREKLSQYSLVLDPPANASDILITVGGTFIVTKSPEELAAKREKEQAIAFRGAWALYEFFNNSQSDGLR